tara:strand:+ start:102 stop:734 length:633 start_codon:yes stop_codon:yes gene_type:complete
MIGENINISSKKVKNDSLFKLNFMIKETILEISRNFKDLSENCIEDIEKASQLMIHCLDSGGKIIFCGNGGSAADSQHLAAELTGRYLKNRIPLAAISLTTDTSAITAIGNDFSFEEIFSRQLDGLGCSKDILYAISTSGNSRNIIRAIETAKEKNIKTIGITGSDGGDMNDKCDMLIKVPASRTDRIQEMHIAVGQILCEIIEKNFFKN